MSDVRKRARELLAAKRRELEARHPWLKKLPTLSRSRPVPAPLPPTPAMPAWENLVVLGKDSNGLKFALTERERLEHQHVIGTTGAGKTNLMEHQARQDILNGRGVLVIDPHGNHPTSLYRNLLTWTVESGISKRRVVHLIDPNNDEFVTGFNPLALPEGHDPAVVAEATLECFQRLWGDEDPDSKPTIQRLLPAVFTALSERGLTLAEALMLLHPDDPDGLRELMLREGRNQYAQEELQWLADMGGDKIGRRDLRIEVVGPRNRIAKLVRADTIRTMVGQTERVIDLREAMDESHIILCNLAGGARVYDKAADLIGRLLLRFIYFHAKRRRKPHIPFFIFADECQRFLSGDVPNILAELRKQGCAVVLGHQWQSQLSKVDEEILSAVRGGTNIKTVFRIKDHKEATDLAEMVVPLNLELPVQTLMTETVVRYERGTLKNASATNSFGTSTGVADSITDSESETRTEGTTVGLTDSVSHSTGTQWSETFGESETDTVTKSWSETFGESDSRTNTDSWAHIVGESSATSEAVTSGRASSYGWSDSASSGRSRGDSESYTPPEGLLGTAELTGTTVDRGSSSSTGHTDSYSRGVNSSRSSGSARSWSDALSEGGSTSATTGTSHSVTEGGSVSKAIGKSHAVTTGQSETDTVGRNVNIGLNDSVGHTKGRSVGRTTSSGSNQGVAHSRGESEALIPILEFRPGAVHSKENAVYMAAQSIRSLRTGTAYVSYVGENGLDTAIVHVPERRTRPLSEDAFNVIRAEVFNGSPSAVPMVQAQAHIRLRREKLIAAASTELIAVQEEPESFRVPATGRSGKRPGVRRSHDEP